MRSIALKLYGVAAYVLFVATTAYTIAFIGRAPWVRNIDTPTSGGPVAAVAIDLVLLGLFAVQHSVMARAGFKRWWTRVIPEQAERSTYVLLATALLALMVWQWRALPAPVWSVSSLAGRAALWTLFGLGWVVVFTSTFLINHLEFVGLSQAFGRVGADDANGFVTPLFYRLVRHPIYLGFIIAFWATPDLSVGHALFAAAATGYIFVGMALEERDLIARFGERYLQYRRHVRALIPLPRRR